MKKNVQRNITNDQLNKQGLEKYYNKMYLMIVRFYHKFIKHRSHLENSIKMIHDTVMYRIFFIFS